MSCKGLKSQTCTKNTKTKLTNLPEKTQTYSTTSSFLCKEEDLFSVFQNLYRLQRSCHLKTYRINKEPPAWFLTVKKTNTVISQL